MTALGGVVMELEDLNMPLYTGAVATSDPDKAFKDVDYAIFLGAFPRKDGMERKDVMSKNVGIFNAQGRSLSANAKPTVKCVVVGNPANTNAAILSRAAPNIPPANISALTRLDHNRASSMVAIKLGVSCADVDGVIIWGNHSGTQYPDLSHAAVAGKPAAETIDDDDWVKGTFVSTVQKRGAAVIAARKLSSAASAANAVCDHMHDWVLGSGSKKFISMAVLSDGAHYDVPAGIFYSFPVKCHAGEWSIIDGLAISDFSRQMMQTTAEELQLEIKMADELLAEAAKAS